MSNLRSDIKQRVKDIIDGWQVKYGVTTIDDLYDLIEFELDIQRENIVNRILERLPTSSVKLPGLKETLTEEQRDVFRATMRQVNRIVKMELKDD